VEVLFHYTLGNQWLYIVFLLVLYLNSGFHFEKKKKWNPLKQINRIAFNSIRHAIAISGSTHFFFISDNLSDYRGYCPYTGRSIPQAWLWCLYPLHTHGFFLRVLTDLRLVVNRKHSLITRQHPLITRHNSS
jgi:hypothetical protein